MKKTNNESFIYLKQKFRKTKIREIQNEELSECEKKINQIVLITQGSL